jgi:hypothetical protein
LLDLTDEGVLERGGRAVHQGIVSVYLIDLVLFQVSLLKLLVFPEILELFLDLISLADHCLRSLLSSLVQKALVL